MTSPAPGWYPDPHVPSQMRWWDGTGWTDDTYERTLPLESGLGTRPAGTVGRTAERLGSPSTRPVTTGARTTDDGVPLSPWGWRALARIVDGVVVNLLALLVAYPATSDVFAVLREQLSQNLQSAQTSAATTSALASDPRLLRAVGVITLVELLVSLAYEMGFLLWRQATPGKLLVGLRVRPWQAGARLTPTVVARRWLASEGASSVPNIGFLYYVFDVLWPLRDPRLQALHDKFAGTCVVRPRR